ncbi:MAG: hypothetical protein C0501_17215 [Isosphaera sp.]|nr:hypothetical protein [Isosphaera sp.]
MTDATTKKPLRVSVDGTAGPYILVPGEQLAEVERLLRSHGVRCWTDGNAISLNDAPAVGVINLGRRGNAVAVQSLLDAHP